ncbi:radical SAM protein [Archaeoglobales archaeon]|nr:MAG: radical SAM protein [Archaeoglobales archaeon]
MRQIEAGSYYSYLTEGCKLCREGAKLVLFITGLCNNSCFYCPISEEKRGKDVVFANERKVVTIDDFVEEVNLMDAEGVAITGGEPLLKLERVLEFLKLSDSLGLHSHLYTSIPAKESVIESLSKFLDEIRFHPVELKNVGKYEESLVLAKKHGIEAGFEIPAIDYNSQVVEILNRHDAFLNLNELECSPTNFEALITRNFEIEDYYVDCNEIAKKYEIVEKFHYCTARFKDSVQFRRRLLRMAHKLANNSKIYEVTDDGTIVCGFVEGNAKNISKAKKILRENRLEFVEVENGIEVSISTIEKLGEYLKAEGLSLSVIERYPTSKRTVVEVIPL